MKEHQGPARDDSNYEDARDEACSLHPSRTIKFVAHCHRANLLVSLISCERSGLVDPCRPCSAGFAFQILRPFHLGGSPSRNFRAEVALPHFARAGLACNGGCGASRPIAWDFPRLLTRNFSSREHLAEVRECSLEALAPGNHWLPPQDFPGPADVRAAHFGIVHGEGLENNRALIARDLQNLRR